MKSSFVQSQAVSWRQLIATIITCNRYSLQMVGLNVISYIFWPAFLATHFANVWWLLCRRSISIFFSIGNHPFDLSPSLTSPSHQVLASQFQIDLILLILWKAWSECCYLVLNLFCQCMRLKTNLLSYLLVQDDLAFLACVVYLVTGGLPGQTLQLELFSNSKERI